MTTGAYTLRTTIRKMIVVRCEECGREGRWRRETLIARYGEDTAMPDLLRKVTASCPRWGNRYYERCRAVYANPEDG